MSIIEDLSRSISDAMPENIRRLQGDLEDNVRYAVQSALQRMDLVTREQFDVQSKVLARTREKLEALEKRVDELEQKLK